MNIRAIIVVCTLGLISAGCVSTAVQNKSNAELIKELLDSQIPPSPMVRKAIVNAARDYLVDPYSVRDAEISSVVTNVQAGLQVVCVKYNAKNRSGGYTGRTTTSVRLKDGQPVSTADNPPICRETGLKYYSFPEVMALRNL